MHLGLHHLGKELLLVVPRGLVPGGAYIMKGNRLSGHAAKLGEKAGFPIPKQQHGRMGRWFKSEGEVRNKHK